MKRLGIVLMVALAACTASKPEGAVKRDATPEVGVIGSLPPAPPSQRYHYDMANFGATVSTCDYRRNETVRHLVEGISTSRSAVRARILSVGAPRWNSLSGKKPTQAEADAIVDGPLEYGAPAAPSIYRPVTVKVEKVYSGTTSVGTMTVYAESGRIGKDYVTSCAFGSADRLVIRDGPLDATVGESYVFILEHRLIGTTINTLFLIQGPLVVGLTGKLEPLP